MDFYSPAFVVVLVSFCFVLFLSLLPWAYFICSSNGYCLLWSNKASLSFDQMGSERKQPRKEVRIQKSGPLPRGGDMVMGLYLTGR